MFNLDLSKTYFHPVVFDTVDAEGKKLKIDFDAEFPRLTQEEIKEILDAKPVNTTEETVDAFKAEAIDCVMAGLKEVADLTRDQAKRIGEQSAISLLDKFGGRIFEKKSVTDETVSKRVLVGWRKVQSGGVDVPFNDETKARLLNVRGAIGAIAKSWLKSIGIEGVAKN